MSHGCNPGRGGLAGRTSRAVKELEQRAAELRAEEIRQARRDKFLNETMDKLKPFMKKGYAPYIREALGSLVDKALGDYPGVLGIKEPV